jgi:ADP-ribose pyrophosphatase YjhB (NUDIX family)
VQAIIVREDERLLLLSSPTRNRLGEWQVISGSLEAAETVLAGVLREVREEAGPELRVRPLGVVHTHTFHFDAQVRYMIGIYYLLAYEGGAVQPGDDMRDAHYRWWSVEELTTGNIQFHVSTQLWILQRAVALYRCWKDLSAIPLQPELNL